jgi:SNF family Na+-dependent transporter
MQRAGFWLAVAGSVIGLGLIVVFLWIVVVLFGN